MGHALKGAEVLVAGGDERELLLVRRLLQVGARVWMAGFPDDAIPPGAAPAGSIAEVAPRVAAILCPMSGTDAEGRIRSTMDPHVTLRLDEAGLGSCRPGTLLLIGQARPVVRALAERLGLRLVELAADEELALLNAVPTAEGAIALAMANMRTTLHDSHALVVGLGRCGQQIARLLLALGAHVRAVAFNRVEAARAYVWGVPAVAPDELGEAVQDVDVVFNTAPVVTLQEPVLARMRPDAVIVDIASEPGGTDFRAAERRGLRAIHALGLPGRVAPRTAGRILASVVPEILAQHLRPDDAARSDPAPGELQRHEGVSHGTIGR